MHMISLCEERKILMRMASARADTRPDTWLIYYEDIINSIGYSRLTQIDWLTYWLTSLKSN
jgi:hypothetical protein